MQAIQITDLSQEAKQALMDLYRTTRLPRMRTRAQMILLSAEQGLKAGEIARIVRESERTVQRWLKRYQAEGIQALWDAPKSGSPGKVTQAYKEQLLSSVRQRPRALGLEFSLWTLERLADYLAGQTTIRLSGEAVRQHLKTMEIVLSRPQHKISSPDPEYLLKKRRWKINVTS
jgi:transposase